MFPLRKTVSVLFAVSVFQFFVVSSVSVLTDNNDVLEDIRHMFSHAFDNYMKYAFPHDELKPLSKSYTDSLGELGNLQLEHLSETYNGTALTLVDSLSSLAIFGNSSEFEKAVLWLGKNLNFDVDVRVNVFECNIRLLGGLISAHTLAINPSNGLMSTPYKGELLRLAEDLGRRLLPAFETETGIPYAWVNLKYGVRPNETTETSTSGCGSLILEFGMLSRLTQNPIFENLAKTALRKLWSMRSPLNLVGATLNMVTGEWIEFSGGIGGGVDSFYEYLLKGHILFGEEEYLFMFQSAYAAVLRHYREGAWYREADMRTGETTYRQFTSLQAFWPALQVLAGDVQAANDTHRQFFDVWEKFGVFPERYLFDAGVVHPTEKYYPLRPELAESTWALWEATRDPWYQHVGRRMVLSLNSLTRVAGGFASVRDVTTLVLEDHQHSFFLAETLKYLYLLFDDKFLAGKNFVFSTEGHPLPVLDFEAYSKNSKKMTFLGKSTPILKYDIIDEELRESPLLRRTCLNTRFLADTTNFRPESVCHVADKDKDHKCTKNKDCGVDAKYCRKRTCSVNNWCGIWVL